MLADLCVSPSPKQIRHIQFLQFPSFPSTMSLPIIIIITCLLPIIPPIHALPAPRGVIIDCGASTGIKSGYDNYIPDEGLTLVGNKTSLPQTPNMLPILSTLRYFPDKSARKYCYDFQVIKGGKYMVRATFYYGGFDGGDEPPVFDMIIQGTRWCVVNTTEDYANGRSSYYEIVLAASGKTLSVCLARNENTVGDPFISAVEYDYLEDSVYNSTDFSKYALSTIARHSFGTDGDIIRYPDDDFNRYWQPYNDSNPVVESKSKISTSDFWNLPPVKVFETAITTSRGKTLKMQWPPVSLPSSGYYISLYFQDNRTPSPYSWRVFNVSINGENFCSNLNVTTNGVTVYGSVWPLSGTTQITMVPAKDIPVGPVINAGEVLQLLPLGGKTVTRDVTAMEDLARSFNNPPADWSGDPCLPKKNSWTGVECTMQGKVARVSVLNLTNVGLSGSLSPSIANLTSLTDIWLGGNKITGNIPDIGFLKGLETLHLENNQLDGSIPESLGELPNLREIYLQGNHLEGGVPQALQKRSGAVIQISPDNGA